MGENQKEKVLFMCKNNSGRSQMAEGLLKHHYAEYYSVYSAGSDPKEVNPLVIEVMAEIGIDISKNESKHYKQFLGQEFDYLVTLCGSEEGDCPVFLGGKTLIHHGFKDPAEVKGTKKPKLVYFREIRDDIGEWVEREFSPE